MVRSPTVDKHGVKRGAWSEEEDKKLKAYVQRYGHWNWRQLPKFAGLARCGKSCRLRYLNYLMPGLKKGTYSKEEEELIIKLHQEVGNKWSTIATKLPGRTDNEIKNYWNSHLKKKKSIQKQMQQDPKSTEKTKGKSQKIHQVITTTDQKDQDSSSYSSISISESTTQGEISSSNYNYDYDYDYDYDSKFFDSFWTEPFFPSYNNNNNNNDNNSCSRVLDLDLEEWIAENDLVNSFQTLSTESSDALISPSTSSCNNFTNSIFEQVLSDPQTLSTSSSSNDLISCADDVFGGFWNEPAVSFSSFDTLPPVMEEGIFNNISSSFEYYDIDDLFHQF